MRASSVPPAASRMRHSCVMCRAGSQWTRPSPVILSARRGPAKAPERRSRCAASVRTSLMVGGPLPEYFGLPVLDLLACDFWEEEYLRRLEGRHLAARKL